MLSEPDFLEKKVILAYTKDGDKISFKNDNIIITDADGTIKLQLSCYRLFAIFIIGGISLTSGIISRSKKFGYRLQYSVFEITNSKRMLDNIMSEISSEFEKEFDQTDSIIIIETSKNCKITKWGYAKNDNSDILVVS